MSNETAEGVSELTETLILLSTKLAFTTFPFYFTNNLNANTLPLFT